LPNLAGFFFSVFAGGKMKYKFLSAWTKQNERQNLYFFSLRKTSDQYAIFFKKSDRFLQINLASEDSFCFFSEYEQLSFLEHKNLSLFKRYLANANLREISISQSDRIIFLHFEKTDIYNQKEKLLLILEFIPHYLNLILTKKNETGKDIVLEALKKISFAENRHRQVLPGLEYSPPLSNYQNEHAAVSLPIHLSPDGKFIENSSESPSFDSLNELFENLYYEHILRRREQKIKEKKIRELEKQIAKKENKSEKLQRELNEAKAEKKWRQFAELLKGNFSEIKSGMKSVSVKNYFEEGFPILEIPLFPDKTARQNVEFYFKKFKKAKKGKQIISKQIEITLAEISQLKKRLEQISQTEIFTEKIAENQNKRQKKEHFKTLRINDNWQIYVGRTAKENDLLTTKFAKPHDWWFHTRIYHGTHLILRNYKRLELPEKLKILCCRIAAYFSKAGKSSNVPVDYTQVRFVRKPRGSASGLVTYTNQKTLYVDPISWRDAAKIIEKEWSQK